MLCKDPSLRITISDALQQDWFISKKYYLKLSSFSLESILSVHWNEEKQFGTPSSFLKKNRITEFSNFIIYKIVLYISQGGWFVVLFVLL